MLMNLLVSAPDIYIRLRNLMEDPDSRIEDFIEAVNNYPNLASAILNVVNSPFIGSPVQIKNVSSAVNFLGIGQLYDMVLNSDEFGVVGIMFAGYSDKPRRYF
jgi:HD-like signal output (HDOD) protein